MDISQLITNMKFKCLQSMKDKKKNLHISQVLYVKVLENPSVLFLFLK